jgi:starch-binding outer membrane protein, SusD/RagB family
MYAEAINELNNGPSGEAIAAFEQVRTRGFGNNSSLIGTTPATYEGFFQAIMNERSFELAGEGLRKYDLIRWNKLGQRLDEVKAELLAMSNREAPYDQLPEVMYFNPGVSGQIQWLNSFYLPVDTENPPAGSASVAWFGPAISTTILQYYAVAFTPNKSELLPLHTTVIDANPMLTQDYGY